jgi:hypothetical protein
MPNNVGFSKPTPFFSIVKPTLLKKEEVLVTVEPTPL